MIQYIGTLLPPSNPCVKFIDNQTSINLINTCINILSALGPSDRGNRQAAFAGVAIGGFAVRAMRSAVPIGAGPQASVGVLIAPDNGQGLADDHHVEHRA